MAGRGPGGWSKGFFSTLLDPQYALAHNNRGISYQNLGQHQRAIEDYHEAIRLDPQYALAYYNRGNAYSVLGQFQRAIEDHDEAIGLDPEFALARIHRRTPMDGVRTAEGGG